MAAWRLRRIVVGRPAVGAEGRGEVLGLLGAALDDRGGLALGVAGGVGLTLREPVGSLVHRPRGLLAQGLRGFLRRPAGPVAEGPGAVAEVGQLATECDRLVAQLLLRRDPLGQDRLQALAHLPLAPGQLLGRGRRRGRQAELGVGRDRAAVRAGGAGPDSRASRAASASAASAAAATAAFGSRSGAAAGARKAAAACSARRTASACAGSASGASRFRSAVAIRCWSSAASALAAVRLGEPRAEGALVLGQLGGEVVGGDAPAQLLVQAIERGAGLGLEAGQGIAELLLLRRRHVRRAERLERVGHGLEPLPGALVLGCVAGSGLERGECVRRLGLLLDERLEPPGQLVGGAGGVRRLAVVAGPRAGLAEVPLEVARGLVRQPPCLVKRLPRRRPAGRGIGQGVGQALQRGLRLGLLRRDLAGRRRVVAQRLGGLRRALLRAPEGLRGLRFLRPGPDAAGGARAISAASLAMAS